MKPKIVRLEIVDNDLVGAEKLLDTYHLVNPDKDKLAELKKMIERRFDYTFDENISDEEFEKAEELCSNIWEAIELFINANFVVLDIDETYEIQY